MDENSNHERGRKASQLIIERLYLRLFPHHYKPHQLIHAIAKQGAS